MTQEEKQLLIQELCARSPYKVKVQIDFGEHCIKYGIDRYVDDTVICVWPETFEVGVNDEDQACDIEDVKPYLRTMSSMTEEEREEEKKLLDIITRTRNDLHYLYTDFLLSHHLDYRGLIPMGLALEAPKDLYSNESEYDENGWKDLGNGLKVNRLGHVELTEEGKKRLEDLMYDENGWKYLGNGLKMDRHGHIAGGLKLK